MLFNRRQFLANSTLSSAALVASGKAAGEASAERLEPLLEHGFWDYTTPGTGGMEGYEADDYRLLLDDMAEGGMNSLCIYVKWLTTGYRSRLFFLDQLPGCPAIASDNRLIRTAIEEAHKRRIKVWLGVVGTYYDVRQMAGSKPWTVYETLAGYRLPVRVGVYDSDTPGLTERIVAIYGELLDLFPGVDGYIIELEGCGVEGPHRIPLYNQWAHENGRPPFGELGHPLDPRYFDVAAWRDYTTYSRLKVVKAVEESVRGKGYGGDLAMICETANTSNAAFQEVNLSEYKKQFPRFKTVTYEYDKWNHRYAMMDLCLDLPRRQGLEVFYLPRGVMTWGMSWPLPLSLEQSWQFDLEDIRKFKPRGVWWFGSGAKGEGAHVSLSRLRKSGYKDGVDARRALIRAAKSSLHT